MSYFNNCFICLNPNLWNSFSAKDALKTLTIFFSILVSSSTLANVAVWSGFGGAEKNDGVFVFPSSADSWAGYANTNDSIYPLSFPEGGIITFTASANSPVDVRFRLEWQPYPDVDPSYNTSSVTVNGATETTYSIPIPSQGSNTFSSFILYLDDRDASVLINNVQITANSNQVGCDSSSQSNGVIKVEAECFSSQAGIQLETTTDTGGGQNVGYIDAFDSMTYVVDVPSTSNYLLSYRTASQAGSDPGFRVFIDNEYSDLFSIPSTDGWQSWQTQQGRVVSLSAGAHVIKLDAASAGMNINWFSLTPTNSAADDAPQNGNNIDVNGQPVDSTKWFHQTLLPNGSSWFNNEVQHYTNRVENSYVSDGTLKIVARKEAFTDQGVTKQYTSARLNSKFAFKYGVVEFRAKMPIGGGTWPAVWMLGKNISESGTYWASQGYGTTSWPAVGEIDILEHWGNNQNYAQSALHTTSSHGATINHGGRYISGISSQFHNYSMDWDANRIIFKVNGVEHYRYNPSVKNADTWPYDEEFFFLLNVAIQPSIVSGFTESAMEVDYIRVYQSGDLVWSDEFNGESDFDGDGYLDSNDAFPTDPNETTDTDSDGIGNNSDADDDGDGVLDAQDAFPLNNSESLDTDNDGIGNNADTDDDGDGVSDSSDAFPLNSSETLDTDSDGIGNNADSDDDGDGIPDTEDSEPLTPNIMTDFQIISVSNNPIAANSQQVTLDIGYDVSTGNNSLTGLGLRIHYDSSVLEFIEVVNLLTTDNIINGSLSEPDSEDYDGNPSTDRFVPVAWASIFGDWPSEALPTNLLSLKFMVSENAATQYTEYSTIGFSKTSNAQGFGFTGENYELQIVPASWDFDKNGEADALTDGLLMLRHTFGLTGDALLNGAVATDSSIPHSDVEQSLVNSMVIADIDNNGQVDALTDGLLLLRYLFGLVGDTLIDGAVALDANRGTHSEIEQYILNHMPGESIVAPDNNPPQISLNGDSTVGLAFGDNYIESGASAVDAEDGDVVVTITGSIGAEQGTYTLTYSAVDAAGNSSSVTRTIVVDLVPNISSFSFLAANNSMLSNDVILDVGANTITGRIPENVSVKQLIASFQHEGATITVSSSDQSNNLTANDFTQPVEYRVSKSSGVSKTYSVDVTKYTGLPIVNIITDNFVPIDSKDDYVTGTVSVDGGRHISDMDATPIEIRGRGNSTWGHPKKPYQMKFDTKEEFLDMPKDKKWIFLAEYSDKSLLRNTTAFELGYISDLDWTPQGEFAEVFINNEYVGTYNITQKVEESGRRVDISNDGFLLEVDQDWRLKPDDVHFATDQFPVIVVKEPGIDRIDQNDTAFLQDDRYIYIRDYINQFEEVLFGSNFASTTAGYAAYIDVDSFVDWFLINEIVKNVDARWFSSIYFHMSPGGKIKMGPLWDHDLGFGNVDYADSRYTNGWWIQTNPWINRLLDDPAFVATVKTKFEFYQNNQQYILDKIDAYAEKLQWAQQENYSRWPTLGQYVWPNPVVFDTYQGEVDHLKQWYQDRMVWLDNAIDSLDGESQAPITTPDNIYVTFQVDMNAVETNAEGVYLAGGDLGQTGYLMTDNGNDIWSVTLELTPNTRYLYKFRNQPSYGTWNGFESGEGLAAGGCNTGNWDDRFIDVGDSDMVLNVVAYGSCTSQPY
jgi:beta-glucanase (GH16 family)